MIRKTLNWLIKKTKPPNLCKVPLVCKIPSESWTCIQGPTSLLLQSPPLPWLSAYSQVDHPPCLWGCSLHRLENPALPTLPSHLPWHGYIFPWFTLSLPLTWPAHSHSSTELFSALHHLMPPSFIIITMTITPVVLPPESSLFVCSGFVLLFLSPFCFAL